METKEKKQRHVICMVSDFFYPNVGGVEEHIFQLSQCLLGRGHKVIVLTHVYGNRRGVRHMTNGLKVYYLPIQPFYSQSVLPTFITSIPLLRNIFVRERVTIVHGHSAFSTMAHEAMNLARAMGLKSVFTDHSLFGFADMSAIVTNNFLAISLADVNHCICVSYVGKENTVLRANVDQEKVSVIPNALDTQVFMPDPDQRPKDKSEYPFFFFLISHFLYPSILTLSVFLSIGYSQIQSGYSILLWKIKSRTSILFSVNVIVMSRLQYRKGVDLQPEIIRRICSRYPQVNFIIGGDGPKRSILEEVRDEVGSDRLELLGAVPHANVHGVLVKGHIFLNTSLTEAFCIAICEAVCSGLQVVSTNVGGIPEVLPSHLILLAHPNVDSLTQILEVAIQREITGRRINPWAMHREMRNLYTWPDVARRTEIVYDKVRGEKSSADIYQRIPRYKKCGLLAGWFMMFLVTLQFLLLKICDRIWPIEDIDIAPDYPEGNAEWSYGEVDLNSRRHTNSIFVNGAPRISKHC